jgi:REP-associated tyrosine transposase
MKKIDTKNICRGGFQTRPPASLQDSVDARFPNRRCLRLSDYDYSTPGAYFVTACTYKRVCILSKVRGPHVVLSTAGQIVEDAWHGLTKHYPGLALDDFVVMPNHVHGIVFLDDGAPTLSEIMRGFKTFAARRINVLQDTLGRPVWQRGFHEHVVRNEEALGNIRAYIRNNPAKWHLDRENPDAVRAGLKPAPTNNE